MSQIVLLIFLKGITCTHIMNRLSDKISRIQPSMTMHLAQKAHQLKLSGEDIISLVAGVPGFETPETASEAGIQAIKDGFTQYTQVDGIPELRQAISGRYHRDFGLKLTLDEVMVTTGAKHCLHNVFNCLLNPGDEVIMHAPFWVSYPDMVRLCDATPVIIEGQYQHDLKLTADELREHLTNKTKILIMCNPNNPSGVVYNEAELLEIAEVLREYPNVILVSDDIYDMIYWGKTPAQMLNVAPDLKDRTIIVNGVSKSYSMSGWRIGYTIAPADIIKAMVKFQSQSLSNPCSISQKAALSALSLTHQDLQSHIETYKKRVEMVWRLLNEMEGVKCIQAEGTFYLFPNIQQAMKKMGIHSDINFCERLLSEEKLALTPGTAFGLNGYIRVTCSFSDSDLLEGMKRLQAFIQKG